MVFFSSSERKETSGGEAAHVEVNSKSMGLKRGRSCYKMALTQLLLLCLTGHVLALKPPGKNQLQT